MTLVWNADLSTGDYSQYGGWEYGGTSDNVPPLSERVAVGTTLDGYTPAQGSYLMRITVAPGDVYFSTSGWRTIARMPPEYTNGGNIVMRGPGYDSSYTWCALMPSGWPGDANLWLSGVEWHHTGVSAPAPHHMIIWNGYVYVDVRGGTESNQTFYVDQQVLSGYAKDTWYVFTERYLHNLYPNGHYELWAGRLGTDSTMQRLIYAPNIGTMYSGFNNYMLFGTYRAQSGSTINQWYTGGFREYTTLGEALSWGNLILSGTPTPPASVPAPGAPYNFGMTSAESSGTWLGDLPEYKRGSPFTVPANCGSVNYLYEYAQGAGSDVHKKAVIYAMDAAGAPGTLLGVSSAITVSGTASPTWTQYTFSSPVDLRSYQGQEVLLATLTDGDVETLREIATSQQHLRLDSYSTGPSNPWSASVGGGSTGTYDNQLALCAVYTPATSRVTTTARSTSITRTIDPTGRIAGRGGGGI